MHALRLTRKRLRIAAAVTVAVAALALALKTYRDSRLPDHETTLGLTGLVSGITATSRDIYRNGQTHGSNPHVFSVVGDSISVDSRFLRPFAAGAYDLGPYGELEAAIRFFAGPDGRGANPFSVPSVAAAVGWMTESVLNPALASPSVCQPGETPLDCELRLAQPAAAIIMLGTNDLAGGRTPDAFRTNLRAIVRATIAQGAIPVLSTIPPFPLQAALDARVSEFNAIIRQTAREFDTPLMDYWAALQPLPDKGISADGVHPNAPPDGQSAVFDPNHLDYGYTVRNWLTLDALDQLRRRVLD